MGHWVRKVIVTCNCKRSTFTVKGRQKHYDNAASGIFFLLDIIYRIKKQNPLSICELSSPEGRASHGCSINQMKLIQGFKKSLCFSCWQHNDLNTCTLPSISAGGITHGSSLNECVWGGCSILQPCLIPSHTSEILKCIIFSFHLHTNKQKAMETVIKLEDRVMFSVLSWLVLPWLTTKADAVGG